VEDPPTPPTLVVFSPSIIGVIVYEPIQDFFESRAKTAAEEEGEEEGSDTLDAIVDGLLGGIF
jgi:hypothetical protein